MKNFLRKSGNRILVTLAVFFSMGLIAIAMVRIGYLEEFQKDSTMCKVVYVSPIP